ncbi:hypothetical protein R3P38DRAFT_2783857 [Favolaschia claudopus]|uniref:F-box domain-containing protein n=1 Tax=Favolaschia claudopus TaxID=2862362 RepID=A0AAW0B3F4_9AGAR
MSVLINEVLEQILEYAIAEATDRSFSRVGQHPIDLIPDHPQPNFGRVFPRTAGACFLKVCRQWHSCGLRPLYRTVVLSNQTQVASLAYALQQNHERGRYIKVLVLYNHILFGDVFQKVVEYMKNLHTLSISVNLDHRRNFRSLLTILPFMKPRELILRDVPFSAKCFPKSQPRPIHKYIEPLDSEERTLLEQISHCIKHSWKDSLEVLRMVMPTVNGNRHSPIYEALPFATQLREIHIRKSAILPVHPFAADPPMTIEYLKKLRHLKVLVLQCQPFELAQEYLDDDLAFRVDFVPFRTVDDEEFYYTGS